MNDETYSVHPFGAQSMNPYHQEITNVFRLTFHSLVFLDLKITHKLSQSKLKQSIRDKVLLRHNNNKFFQPFF